MMDNFQFDDNIENLKIISSCPVCSQKYNMSEIKILERKNDAHLIYIQCPSCRSSVLAVILANYFGVSSVGLVTDLTSRDVLKFKNLDNVTTNDVIEIHKEFDNKEILNKI